MEQLFEIFVTHFFALPCEVRHQSFIMASHVVAMGKSNREGKDQIFLELINPKPESMDELSSFIFKKVNRYLREWTEISRADQERLIYFHLKIIDLYYQNNRASHGRMA